MTVECPNAITLDFITFFIEHIYKGFEIGFIKVCPGVFGFTERVEKLLNLGPALVVDFYFIEPRFVTECMRNLSG